MLQRGIDQKAMGLACVAHMGVAWRCGIDVDVARGNLHGRLTRSRGWGRSRNENWRGKRKGNRCVKGEEVRAKWRRHDAQDKEADGKTVTKLDGSSVQAVRTSD